MLLVALGASGYLVYRHMSNNIAQVNLEAYIGKQPADLHPQAENILIIGSGSARGAAAGAAGVGSESGTLMLVHIAANRQWAEVMSIPPRSLVSTTSYTTADGKLYASAQSKANHVALGLAFTIRALERDSGIYINHFIVVNDNGFKGMVGALGGVEERNQTAIDNPRAGLVLTPAQALAYAHGLYGPGGSSGRARMTLQEALAGSLITRARSDLSDPLATYRFLDAFTRSLTIDSQLGGITGLYHLAQSLHGMQAGKIAMFALPGYPRAGVARSGARDVLWTQSADSEIFASFRNDVQASPALLAAASRPDESGVLSSVTSGTCRGSTAGHGASIWAPALPSPPRGSSRSARGLASSRRSGPSTTTRRPPATTW